MAGGSLPLTRSAPTRPTPERAGSVRKALRKYPLQLLIARRVGGKRFSRKILGIEHIAEQTGCIGTLEGCQAGVSQQRAQPDFRAEPC